MKLPEVVLHSAVDAVYESAEIDCELPYSAMGAMCDSDEIDCGVQRFNRERRRCRQDPQCLKWASVWG